MWHHQRSIQQCSCPVQIMVPNSVNMQPFLTAPFHTLLHHPPPSFIIPSHVPLRPAMTKMCISGSTFLLCHGIFGLVICMFCQEETKLVVAQQVQYVYMSIVNTIMNFNIATWNWVHTIHLKNAEIYTGGFFNFLHCYSFRSLSSCPGNDPQMKIHYSAAMYLRQRS